MFEYAMLHLNFIETIYFTCLINWKNKKVLYIYIYIYIIKTAYKGYYVTRKKGWKKSRVTCVKAADTFWITSDYFYSYFLEGFN